MVQFRFQPQVAVPNLVSPYTFARILWGYLPRRRTVMGCVSWFAAGTVVGFGAYHTRRAWPARGAS